MQAIRRVKREAVSYTHLEFTYLLWYVFPEKQPSQKELTIKVYDEVLNGQRKAFPRGYFVRGSDVEYKAQVCFQHLCEDILKLDREGICRTFCNSGGIKILQKYKLKIVLDIVYELSLIHIFSSFEALRGDMANFARRVKMDYQSIENWSLNGTVLEKDGTAQLKQEN